MKKTFLIFILIFTLITLFACVGECRRHVDADKNAKCDECGALVPCKSCEDLNVDSKCDVCGGEVARTSRTEAELYDALVRAGYERGLENFREELAGSLGEDTFWHVGESAPEKSYGKSGDLYLFPSELTVYARGWNDWSAIYVFSTDGELIVEFNTGTELTLDSQKTERGGCIALTSPVRLGFEFIGWFYTEGGADIEFTEQTAVTKNLLLTAKWRGTFVTYEDFGAVGNGVTNDFTAIYNTHVYANENRLTVKATDGKRYYIGDSRIGNEVKTIPIKTNTDWGTAEFYIDDSDINYLTDPLLATTDVFTVCPTFTAQRITNSKTLLSLGTTKRTTERISLALGYDAIVVIEDNTHKVFRRYGSYYTASVRSGKSQSDALIVNSVGVIDPATPVTYDFTKCSSATVYRIDTTPLTVTGGKFTTYACVLDAKTTEGSFGDYRRGINVTRSNVTIEGIEHYVEGEVSIEEQKEGVEGVAYSGFIYIENAANVTIRDSVLTARRYYGNETYDFYADTALKLTLDGVRQSNFFINEDGTASDAETEYSSLIYYWGITGTIFSKSVAVKNSTLSRFDAACGLYNGSIEGSRINMIALTGTGSFKVTDTELYSAGTQKSYNSLINLRSDYGSTWNGEIEIKNVTAHIKSADFFLLYHVYSNWDFGYTTHIPSITVDNLRIATPNGEAGEGYEVKLITTHKSLELEGAIHLGVTENTHPIRDAVSFKEDTASYENLNPVAAPKYVRIKNNAEGYVFSVPKSDLFLNTRFVSDSGEETGTSGDGSHGFRFKELDEY